MRLLKAKGWQNPEDFTIEVVNGVQFPLLGKSFNFNVLFCVNVTANDVCTGNSKDPHVISGAFYEVCTVEGEKVLILQ